MASGATLPGRRPLWFTLPIEGVAAPAEAVSEGREDAAGSPPAGHRVLVAEDNEVNLLLIRDLLSARRHTVSVARNGQEAIDLARASRPELILMDVRMPEMDGLEATRRLRQMPEFADLPIVALTASADEQSVRASTEAGCSAHIAKPIDSDELFRVLRDHLGDARG